MNKLLIVAISMMIAGNASCADRAGNAQMQADRNQAETGESDWRAKEIASFKRQIAINRDKIYKCMHSYYSAAEIRAMGYIDEVDMANDLESKTQLIEGLIAIFEGKE